MSGIGESNSGTSWWRCGPCKYDEEELRYQEATLARLDAIKNGEAGAPQATQPGATAPMPDPGRGSREGVKET